MLPVRALANEVLLRLFIEMLLKRKSFKMFPCLFSDIVLFHFGTVFSSSSFFVSFRGYVAWMVFKA